MVPNTRRSPILPQNTDSPATRVLGADGTQLVIEVLNALGIRHSIAPLNEGHAAFVLLERIQRVAGGMSFLKHQCM